MGFESSPQPNLSREKIKESEVKPPEKFKAPFTRGELDDMFEKAVCQKYLKSFEIIDAQTENGAITKEKADEIRSHVIALSKKELGYEITEKYTSMETANRIFGNDYFGPKEVGTTFRNMEIIDSNIPPIPFSRDELERAKEKGMMLMLYISHDNAGNPMTIMHMKSILADKDLANISLLIDNHRNGFDKFDNIDFYNSETSKTSWRLVSDKPILETKAKTYWMQMGPLVNKLIEVAGGFEKLPKKYQQAIDDYDNKKKEIENGEINLLGFDKDESRRYEAKLCTDLEINNLIRETPQQAVYRIILCDRFKNQITKNEISEADSWDIVTSKEVDGYIVEINSYPSGFARRINFDKTHPSKILNRLAYLSYSK